MEKLEKAIQTATTIHREQKRKTGEPYITHLFSVMSLVAEFGGTEDQMIAGLLHDAIEDQGKKINLEQINRMFGSTVRQIVLDCTDDRGLSDWMERKKNHLLHIKTVDENSKLVIACDKIHNMRCCIRDYRVHGKDLWNLRFNRGEEHMKWYFVGLGYSIFGNGFDNSAVEEEFNYCLDTLFQC